MPKKVLFVIPRLGIGGAQKVLTIVINHLDRNAFEPVLCLLEGGGEYIAELSPDVKIINLQCGRVAKSFFKLIKTIKEVRPQIVFSALSHINIMVALCMTFLPDDIVFVARETNIPSINNKQNKRTRIFNFLHRRLYPRYSKIVCQSLDMEQDLLQNFRIPKERLTVINNPIEIEKNLSRAQTAEKLFDENKINLLAAGKLKYQKGFDILLAALAKLNDDKFHLTILGRGELEALLKKQAVDLQIAQRVDFAGQVDNPYPYMRQADLFVLSSRYEGFPNVVLEALSVGTPVIAFNCKGGISEIIAPGLNGALVPESDAAALAEAISKYAGRFFNKEKVEKSVDKFDVAAMIEKYQALFKSLG